MRQVVVAHDFAHALVEGAPPGGVFVDQPVLGGVRAEGVVDFIDIKFFGLFGLDRWPTFNVADSAVVVCGFMLVISFIVTSIKEVKENKSEE